MEHKSNIFLNDAVRLESVRLSYFLASDSGGGVADQLGEPPGEGGPVWCLCGGPQDPADPQ